MYMIVIHHDKKELQILLAKMKRVAKEKMKLEFNEKTEICPIKNGVEYLGFRFYLTDTGKVVQKLKKKKEAAIETSIQKIRTS